MRVNWLFLAKYAKHQLQQNLLDTVTQFRHIYQLTIQTQSPTYQEFFQSYKKFVLFLDQTKSTLALAMLEKLFTHATYDFLGQLLMALREAGEVILDDQRHVLKTKNHVNAKIADDFFEHLVKYAKNEIDQEALLKALDQWHQHVNNQQPEKIQLIDGLPYLFKEAFTQKLKKISPPKVLNKIALIQAIKGAICALTVPMIWIYFTLPGLDQIAISVVAILQIDTLTTKSKGFSRILGCLVGSIIAYLVLGLNINHIAVFLLIVFLVIFLLGYLRHGTQTSALGTQAIIVFLIGAFINLSPAHSLALVFDRLTGIISGVSSVILMMQYLWPLHPTRALFYKLAETRTSIAYLIEQLLLKRTKKNYWTFYYL